MMTSYTMLWPHLSPGGIYVMEDIHVGRSTRLTIPPTLTLTLKPF